MKVAGVLRRTHTTDDLGIFTDVKTTWVIQGLGHGYENQQRKSAAEKEGLPTGHFRFPLRRAGFLVASFSTSRTVFCDSMMISRLMLLKMGWTSFT